MVEEEISEEKFHEILNDKEAVKLISKNWVLRQEIRLLHRKADKLERLIKKNEQDLMNKFNLKWNHVISLFFMEDIIFDKKVQTEIEEKIAEKFSVEEIKD
jgi:hypothetical protein